MSATLLLMVGLPAAGKTTVARVLEVERPAIRFTPDEWMIPLFGESGEGGTRWTVEGRLITTGLRALELGVDVVLDFGLWSREERWSLHWLARLVGARCETRYLEVDDAEQLARVSSRFDRTPQHTFPMTTRELAQWRAVFQVPDAAELDGDTPGAAPSGYATWSDWASWRWPSLVVPS